MKNATILMYRMNWLGVTHLTRSGGARIPAGASDSLADGFVVFLSPSTQIPG
jgi:hypothetical protein